MSGTLWTWSRMGCQLNWDLVADKATLTRAKNAAVIWQGSLLPTFWLRLSDGQKHCVKATVRHADLLSEQGGVLPLQLAEYGTAQLSIVATETGLHFSKMEVVWSQEVPAIISLYFGVVPMTPEMAAGAPTLENPFWPNWQAEGFCIPSAKGAPVQSFFRSWDLGHAIIPLGGFGPSLGMPYAAAYPRPLFCAAMGGEQGWLVAGVGTIPDGAQTFEIRSASGCLHYLYREDLWGAASDRKRIWEEPLRLTWSENTAWDTYLAHFQTFAIPAVDDHLHQRSHWNTWGDFKTGLHNIPALADWSAHAVGADLLCIDDLWETSNGSGIANRERFPSFDDDIRYIKDQGLVPGFWMPTGWIDDPNAYGLSSEDLLCGLDGVPRRANWVMSPYQADHYCLDPSSERTRAFLQQRTQAVMKQYTPQLLKLDFAYGLPSPHVAVPRDPAYRGERMGYQLLKIIVDAAREIDPAVTIQYYGIHPLMRPVTNLIALDDLGDTGSQEREGHQQWSVWSALAAAQGYAITASSGYDWESDSDILLDTAIIGSPGAVLSRVLKDGSPVPSIYLARRQALSRWHRRTTGWTPLWLNSEKGRIGREPYLLCWGRQETIAGEVRLTALALREKQNLSQDENVLSAFQWSGHWALIAQDDQSIFQTRQLACIPLSDTATHLNLPSEQAPADVLLVFSKHEQSFEHWTWVNGGLQLDLPEAIMEQGLLGLLIVSKVEQV